MALRRLLFCLIPILCLCANPSSAATTERVSVASDGAQADGASWSRHKCISGDGRFVALESAASDLVPDDTNGSTDVFVHDRFTGQTERVSVASDGTEAAGPCLSFFASISADGRYVAFSSDATNLVPNDNNGRNDVFVHDRLTGQTTRVSVSSYGTEANGRDIWGAMPDISADGRYVAFCSEASNLVPNDANDENDVFVHDRLTGETELVSVATDGTQTADRCMYPALSADGRYVVFSSDDPDLAPGGRRMHYNTYLRDRQTGTTVYVYEGFQSSISGDGRFVATGFVEVWLVDTQTWESVRVDVASDGTPGEKTSGSSHFPAMTPEAQLIAFRAYSSNLVPGDTNGTGDVFLHDRQSGETVRISMTTDGTQADGHCWGPSISADGRFVSFNSRGETLVPNDTNGSSDVFVRDRLTADFEAAPTAGPGPLHVAFTDLSVNVSPSWLWDFGDGGTSAEQNPTHVYEGGAGRYTVSLTCSGGWGSITETKADYIALSFPDAAPDLWAWEAVLDCFVAGIVDGYSDGLYHPNWSVSRDQMAAFIARALAGGDESVPDGPPPARATFEDVPAAHWAYKYVQYCVANDIVEGLTSTTYGPTLPVGRDQMAVFISRAVAGGDDNVRDGPDIATFDDVPTDQWAYKYIEYCAAEGIVYGYDPVTYGPTVTVSRDQMAVFISRAFDLAT